MPLSKLYFCMEVIGHILFFFSSEYKQVPNGNVLFPLHSITLTKLTKLFCKKGKNMQIIVQ